MTLILIGNNDSDSGCEVSGIAVIFRMWKILSLIYNVLHKTSNAFCAQKKLLKFPKKDCTSTRRYRALICNLKAS